MDRQEFEYLKSDAARALLSENIESDPAVVALKLRNAPLATLIKTLGKCKRKLPAFYRGMAIVTSRSYEQSSSEATARAKDFAAEGRCELAVDLTCGLGVDALAMSRVFRQVIAVESDELRADIARYNFSLLGADNIKVECSKAEEFALPDNVDLVYVDPSREDEDGKRVYSISESSPNVLELMPQLLRSLSPIGGRVMIKLSPLYDLGQAVKDFPDADFEVVSLDGECKEVLVTVFPSRTQSSPDYLGKVTCTMISGGVVHRLTFSVSDIGHNVDYHSGRDILNIPKICFLNLPDVTLYKSRTVGKYAEELGAKFGATLLGGYIFSDRSLDNFMGKSFCIQEVYDYQPKVLIKILKTKGIKRANIHLKEFPYSAAQIQKSLGIMLGGEYEIFFTRIDGSNKVFFVSLPITR